jgi:hypothetical protein
MPTARSASALNSPPVGSSQLNARSRRGSGPLRRWLSDAPRRLSQRFTREHTVNFLKTLSITIPLTLMLWVYAERESAVPQTLTVPIAVKTAAPDRLVWLVGSDERISAEVIGPRARVTELADRLSRGDRVTIAVDASLNPGLQQVPLKEALNRAPALADRGITVQNVQPPIVRVYIDQIVERELPVRLPDRITNARNRVVAMDGPAVFEPPTVTYRGPQRLLDSAGADAHVVARISGRPSLDSPGAGSDSNVPVELGPTFSPASDGTGTAPDQNRSSRDVTLTPDSVSVSFSLRPADRTITVPAIALDVKASPTVLNGVSITFSPESITNIRLTGPPELIDPIEQKQVVLKAYIQVTSADVAQGTVTKVPVYDSLPRGVTVHPDDAGREVNVTFTPRLQ